MFESRISAGEKEKLPCSGKLDANFLHGPMVGHAKKFVERYCELANTTTPQLHKVAPPGIEDHQFKDEANGICWRIIHCFAHNLF